MKENRPSNKTPATDKETKSQVKRHRTQRAPQTWPHSAGPAGISPSHRQRKVKLSSVSAVLKSQHSATMENSMEVPQKKLNLELHVIQKFHFWVYTQENRKQGLENYVHIIFIHNDPKVEATQVSTEWISKMWQIQNVEYYSASKRKEILKDDTS